MTEVSTAAPAATSAESLIQYAMANDVFAALKSGGSISIEEWPGGELAPIAARVDQVPGTLLVEVRNENAEWNASEPGCPCDEISMHPDESDRIALMDRAIVALQNARAALIEVGYVDFAERRTA